MGLRENLQKLKDGQPIKKPAVRKKANGKVVSKEAFSDERFAHALIQNGLNPTAAYRSIKPHVTNNTANTEGRRALRKPSVIALLVPLIEKLFVDAGIDTEYVLRRWLEIAEGSAADYFTFEDGYPVLDMSQMTPAQKANLKKISITQTQHGTNYSIEVHDAHRAIDTIAKHLGLLVEKLPDEDVERIGDMLERAVKRIKATKDLDAWKDIVLDVEIAEVR